jgi:hypothetical protein
MYGLYGKIWVWVWILVGLYISIDGPRESILTPKDGRVLLIV